MGSLRSLTILFLVAFGLATVLTGCATYSASHLAIVRSVDRLIETTGSLMLSEVRPGDARSILSRIDAFSRRRENRDIGFELEDAEGRRLCGNVVLSRKVPFGFSTLPPATESRPCPPVARRCAMRAADCARSPLPRPSRSTVTMRCASAATCSVSG